MEEYLVALMVYFVVEVVFLLLCHRRCTGHLPLLTLVVRAILFSILIQKLFHPAGGITITVYVRHVKNHKNFLERSRILGQTDMKVLL